ncbi:hypothetical protein L798_09487 [Zootermopsis nevadensis]|uniref:Uncharacterized protein n=1 Tax=Zootermopsis nevadensis TaxID=136037 RepID=A0A067RAT7_ZOONE|nr:hypothetical protein L798_09487 [Zootermopsis nevadensis]
MTMCCLSYADNFTRTQMERLAAIWEESGFTDATKRARCLQMKYHVETL